MLQLDSYLQKLLPLLKDTFSHRLLYVGLQGSYARGEANEYSDVDIMVLLDRLTPSDLDTYRRVLQSAGFYDKSCGFICGKREMLHWNPLEICHLSHTTKDLWGILADFLPAYTTEDIKNYCKLEVGNLYHALCHRYIHVGREECAAALPHLYKSVFFILQNLHYLDTGHFQSQKQQLYHELQGDDRAVMRWIIDRKVETANNFDDAFDTLFAWCQNALARLSSNTPSHAVCRGVPSV